MVYFDLAGSDPAPEGFGTHPKLAGRVGYAVDLLGQAICY
jgi:hypothetical protein